MRLLPVLVLVACSTPSDPAATPAKAPAAPAAQAAASPSDAPPATEPPAPKPAATPGEGHCAEGETAWFSCSIDGGRTLSLCGAADAAKLQYRFGPKGAPDLLFPSDSDPAKLAFRHDTWARGYGDTVHFENGGYRYELTSSIMGGAVPEEAEWGNFIGVRVFEARSDVPAVQLACEEVEPEDRLAALVKAKSAH